MFRAYPLLFVISLIAACAGVPTAQQDMVNGAVAAMGGADALAKVRTVAVKGTVKHWEPEQSMSAGGEMRFAAESTFDMLADATAHAARIDWVKKFAYPAPRTFTFSEIITRDRGGYVLGIDSNGRNQQSMKSNPPAHAMSGVRLATAQRELLRANPLLMLNVHRNPSGLYAVPDQQVGSAKYPATGYKVGAYDYIIMFDPATRLPARIRTLDYDTIWGDVNYDLVLSDWQTIDGVRIATTQKYELSGRVVGEVKLTDMKLNVPVIANRFDVPPALSAAAKPAATSKVPYQWVIRRQFIGTYLDSDNPSFDSAAGPGLRLVEVAPGVFQTAGGSHNSLAVEMSDHFVVFDAPVSDWQSNWMLEQLRAKAAGKPVRYLVLTHHHMDHTGGVRAYAAQGATLVVGQGNGAHFRKVLSQPYTRNPDLAARDLSGTQVVEVADRYVMSDGKREVAAFSATNPHANGMVIGYVADAQLGFVTDLWSPGRDPLPFTISPALAAVVNAVNKAGIKPARFAGGHGAVGDYAPLAALAAKKQ